jgi:N-acetylneuraminic acid mutarotase
MVVNSNPNLVVERSMVGLNDASEQVFEENESLQTVDGLYYLSPRKWKIVESIGVAPCERSLHAACVLDDCMYVFGGYDGHTRLNDFYRFSFSQKEWNAVITSSNSGLPPSPRDRHVAVVHGNSFYVFGGFDGTSRVNDLFEFEFSTKCWQQISSRRETLPPSPRHSHSALVFENSLFIFGGYDGSYRSDFHEFDFVSSTWNTVSSTGRPPRARYRATCVLYQRTMIIFGGHDGTRHLCDTQAFDFDNRVWSTIVAEGTPPIPRDSHVSVVYKDSMFIYGGSTGSAMNDLYEFRFSSSLKGSWKCFHQSKNSPGPGHRFCHVGVVYNGSLFIFGGYDGSNRLIDFMFLNLEIDDLSLEVPPSTLKSDLYSLLNNPLMSDIVLLVDHQEIYAHKIMLLRCHYFRALFTCDMKESQEDQIRISNVQYPIFMALLEYLYTDHVNIPIENAMDIFVTADHFCVPRLKSICEKKMLESITVDNAATIFHAADLHAAALLKRKSLKFILTHFENVSKTPAFEEMARGNVELVFEILRNR